MRACMLYWPVVWTEFQARIRCLSTLTLPREAVVRRDPPSRAEVGYRGYGRLSFDHPTPAGLGFESQFPTTLFLIRRLYPTERFGMLETPVLVRSPKLSNTALGQLLDG
jgi:hypothetical protein